MSSAQRCSTFSSSSRRSRRSVRCSRTRGTMVSRGCACSWSPSSCRPWSHHSLRVAVAVGFSAGSGIAESLYALATLWILLKVPGTLHAAAQVETMGYVLPVTCGGPCIACLYPSITPFVGARRDPLDGCLNRGCCTPAVWRHRACRRSVQRSSAGRRLRKPLAHSWVSQGFGCTSFVFEPVDLACAGHHWHSGIDLAAARGSAMATLPGNRRRSSCRRPGTDCT